METKRGGYATYRRFVRLKLERKTTQCFKPNCCTTSACTLGVAVAVRARRGTVGYLHMQSMRHAQHILCCMHIPDALIRCQMCKAPLLQELPHWRSDVCHRH